MLRFLGRDVQLLEPRASHQVTLVLLSEMEKSISSAGIEGTDAFFVLDPSWVGPSRALAISWQCSGAPTHGC